jgi:hypothetical protein
MNQEDALEEIYLLKLWFLTSNLQNCEEKKFCCLTHLKPGMAWALLEVATKVFVNQDQEAKWEANRMMNRKVGLLGAALVGQSGRPWKVNPCNSWGNHHG